MTVLQDIRGNPLTGANHAGASAYMEGLVHRFHGTDLLWPIPEGPPHAVVCRERKHDGWIGWQHLGG